MCLCFIISFVSEERKQTELSQTESAPEEAPDAQRSGSEERISIDAGKELNLRVAAEANAGSTKGNEVQ